MPVVADLAVFAAFLGAITVIATGRAYHKTMFSIYALTTAKSP
jgi:hypothetical protein